jgi:hypothetical protein
MERIKGLQLGLLMDWEGDIIGSGDSAVTGPHMAGIEIPEADCSLLLRCTE